MADCSDGRVSTLPGSRAALPQGAMCDSHPEVQAVARMQGETDSFGCEYADLCAECLAEWKAHEVAARVGVCDWCNRAVDSLRPRRDFEEGMAGPVYQVCRECVQKENEYLAAELDDYD